MANNIIDGVSNVLSKYKSCIVLEDDLILNTRCINYMNKMLTIFGRKKNLGSISAYSYIENFKNKKTFDFYISKRHASWCWGTWAKVWNKIDWKSSKFKKHFYNNESIKKFSQGGKDLNLLLWGNNEKLINSWAIRFNFYCIENSLKSIQPRFSMIKNDGRDFSGTHEKFNFKLKKKYNFNPPLGSLNSIMKRTVKSEDIFLYIKNSHRRSLKLSIRFFFKFFKII